jgi:sugar-specific transcriptional regulator TrmB
MKNLLEQLNLTPNEIKVYLALLDLGETTVGPIVKALGIHRQMIYDSLKSLEKRNMVLKTSKNNRFYFRVANPSNIVKNANYQMKVAEDVALLVAEKQKQKQKNRQEITVVEGAKAYKDWILKGCETIPQNSELYLIASNDDNWEDIVSQDDTLEKFNLRRAQKGIKVKAIFGNSMRKEAEKPAQKNYQVKCIEDCFLPPMEIVILPDSVDFTSYGSDIFVINIQNKELRNKYHHYFQKLWKKAV